MTIYPDDKPPKIAPGLNQIWNLGAVGSATR